MNGWKASLLCGLSAFVLGGNLAWADPAADARACDLLAASPHDSTRPADVAGVAADDVAGPAAVAACEKALASNPDSARITFQLARALALTGQQPQRVFDLDSKASAAGHLMATFNLAASYADGIVVPADPAKAAELRCKVAESGIALAMSFCGRAYLGGEGIAADGAKAVFWLQKAVDGGDVTAAALLGRVYDEGKLAPADPVKAAALIERAGRAEDHLWLAHAYEDGKKLPRDPAKAIAHYEAAIRLGSSNAANDLGYAYVEGLLGPQRLEEGVTLLKQAAEKNNMYALHNLGRLSDDGKGMPKDAKAAADFHERAAYAGHIDSQLVVAKLYEAGLYRTKNLGTAAYWYVRSGEKTPEIKARLIELYKAGATIPATAPTYRFRLAETAAYAGIPAAQKEVAALYFDGVGVEKNAEKAIAWYERAVESGSTDAMVDLAYLLENGNGIAKDLNRAVLLLEAAAAKDNHYALRNLARFYQEGLTVPPDERRAFDLLQRAVDKGNVTALAELGYFFHVGKTVPADPAAAMKLYLRGAELGDPMAMNNLGYSLAVGEGVPANLNEGLYWLYKGTMLGGDWAPQSLGEIYDAGKAVPFDGAKAAEFYLMALKRKNTVARRILVDKAGAGLKPETLDAIQARLLKEGYSFTPAKGSLPPEAVQALGGYAG